MTPPIRVRMHSFEIVQYWTATVDQHEHYVRKLFEGGVYGFGKN